MALEFQHDWATQLSSELSQWIEQNESIEMIILCVNRQNPVLRFGRVPIDRSGVVWEEQVLAVGGYRVFVRV